MKLRLKISEADLKKIKGHLLHKGSNEEEAGFLFAEFDETKSLLTYKECLLLNDEDFDFKSDYHISVGSHILPKIIKKAFDFNFALIEIHSHLFQNKAEFSESDFYGFSSFVPHVLWRLKQPYTAIVVANDTYDALMWEKKGTPPNTISGVETEKNFYKPTNLSINHYEL